MPDFAGAIDKLEQSFEKRPSRWDPFISKIVFLHYKRIGTGESMEFGFPLAALVGRNGSNKSSILQALYGVPGNLSPGRFWFSTSLDPIDIVERPRFWYEYAIRSIGATAQVRKMMYRAPKTHGVAGKTGKAGDPDYWEPTPPAVGDGMKPFVRPVGAEPYTSTRRWNTMIKSVAYLDLRSDLTAFDRVYFSETENNRIRAKRRIRGAIKPLRKVLEKLASSRVWYRQERVRVSLEFDARTLENTNYVLGQTYAKIRYAEHGFFGFDGYTFLFSEGTMNYSDAFAGRGEASVARILYRVASAPEASLILLDEPETSLHASAQRRLVEVLAHYALNKGHQIVFATHSPFMLEKLPRDAIKLCIPQADGTVAIQNGGTFLDSMFHLGDTVPAGDVTTVFVEDDLAKFVVEHAIETLLHEATRSQLKVQVLPGGKDMIRGSSLPAHLQMNASANFVYLLDGDARPPSSEDLAVKYPSSDHIPASEDGNIEDLVIELLGTKPRLALDGSGGTANEAQKLAVLKSLYDFILARVFYLPFHNPEAVLLSVLEDEEGSTGDEVESEQDKVRMRAAAETFLKCAPNTIDATLIAVAFRALWKNHESHLEQAGKDIVDVLREAKVVD